MSKYQYLGFTSRTYLGIVIPGTGSLVAEPGQIVEFDDGPPTDGFWCPVQEAKAPVKKEAEEKK